MNKNNTDWFEKLFINEAKAAIKSKGAGGGSSDDDIVITDASYLFYMGARIDAMEKLCSSISNSVSFRNMFYECVNITSVPEIDTSEGVNFEGMFRSCSRLVSIPKINTSKGTNFSYMFRDNGQLTSVPELDIGNGVSFGYMFYYCSKLTDLYLYNIRRSIQIGSSTVYGHRLTSDSLVHIIKELCAVTTSQTLTIGSVNLEKIANLYCKITDATHEKKTMELCESTDEGAMTLTQYAAEKGWQLA